MLIIEKLKNIKGLSQSQQNIVEYILEKKQLIEKMTIKEIAEKTYTSSATFIRLAKNLGYNGFDELKKDYLDELRYLDTHFQNIDANKPFEKGDNNIAIANKIGTLFKESVNDTLSLISHEKLQKAVQLLKNCQTIHYCAISFPLIYGDDFALKMERLAKRVYISKLPGENLYSSALIQDNDIALIVSYSGETPLIKDMISIYKSKNIPIIAITSFGSSYLREHANVTLTISTREKLYSKIAGYSNEVSIKLLLDILYSCYFSLDYDKNFNNKKKLSKLSEKGRVSSSEILKEY